MIATVVQEPGPRPGRRCAWCHGPMSDQRPSTLIAVEGGELLGPFHAGCAERLKIEAEKRPDSNWIKGATSYGRILPGSEETLPW